MPERGLGAVAEREKKVEEQRRKERCECEQCECDEEGTEEARGSRHEMHRAQKNCAGLRPRAVPSFILWGRWRQEMEAGGRSRRAQQEGRRRTTGSRKRRKPRTEQGKEDTAGIISKKRYGGNNL